MHNIDDEIARIARSRKKPTFLGKMNYRLFHMLPTIARQGGYRTYFKAGIAKRTASRRISTRTFKLHSKRFTGGPTQTFNYLVGTSYVQMFLCSALTLRGFLGSTPKIRVFDDGSLSREDHDKIHSCDFDVEVVYSADWMACWRGRQSSCIVRLSQHYPHLRKIMILKYMSDYQIVSDCDVLYFSKSEALCERIKSKIPLFMTDVDEYYGLDRSSTLFTGRDFVERLNAGYYGLDVDRVDFEKLEFLCREYMEQAGFNYLLEQFLTAVMLSDCGATALDKSYSVGGYDGMERNPPNVVHFPNYVQGFYAQFGSLYRSLNS